MLHPLTPQAQKALATYRLGLPKNEADALTTWVQSFWPYQQGWLLEPATFALLNKSRKIGFSHTSAGVATLWGVFHGETTTVISVGERESKEVLAFASKFATILREMGSVCAEQTKTTADEIRFASNGRIIALPASGGRGYSGNVFLDEFAYHEHPEKVWDAAAPVITLGYRIRVVSTPNGVGNSFHELYRIAAGQRPDVPNPWRFYEIPIQQAMAAGFDVDLDVLWGLAKGDPRLFAQMYECSFLDAVLQYIPTEAIDSACVNDAPDLEVNVSKYDYFAGLDIGRSIDLTVLVVVRRDRRTDKVRVVHVETMKRTDAEGLRDLVAAAFERYKPKRLCVDATGIGGIPADEIKKKHSERYEPANRRPRVDLVTFGPKSKEALATGLYNAIAKHELELPNTDAALPVGTRATSSGALVNYNVPGTSTQLQREIASIQRKVTSSSNVVYETPHTSEGHGDRAWALMLALHARDPVHPMLRALRS